MHETDRPRLCPVTGVATGIAVSSLTPFTVQAEPPCLELALIELYQRAGNELQPLCLPGKAVSIQSESSTAS